MTYENLEYDISSIKNWLKEDSEVQLPSVQRNFVWKPSQIECLWDSIFRGYPIGSMMLSKSGNSLMLLDGQQRATAIALGFLNPWVDELLRIGNVKNCPIIWVDVKPNVIPESYRFAIRVTTRSHPWGYQLKDNSSKLSVSNRRAAAEMYMRLFNKQIYTNLLPTERLPYDATLPVPLSFLLEAVLEKDSKHYLIEACKKYIPHNYSTIGLKHRNANYIEELENSDLDAYFDIIRDSVLSTKIPVTIISNDLLIDKEAEDPTLFIRLNSQGTRIEGEELMYSMYKAVCPEVKDLVDSIGLGIIAPSKIIALTARLILSKDKYVANISLPQFKRHVQDKSFVENMNLLIGNKQNSPLSEKVKLAIDALRYNGVPDIIIKKFIKKNPNGLLLLLHWLLQNNISSLNETLKRTISGTLYRTHWFGNLDQFVSISWDKTWNLNFWDNKIKNVDYYIQYPLISPTILQSFLMERAKIKTEDFCITSNDSLIWNYWSRNLIASENNNEDYINQIQAGWLDFMWRLLDGRDKSLILLAQSEYINNTFKEFNQIEDLEDTNTPWDWDHIYPISWVYRQWYIDDRTRKWEQRIGNFRAMSLTDNRSESNNLSPAERFSEPNKDYFIHCNDLIYWQQLNKDTGRVYESNEKDVLAHANAIITRTVNIYNNFLTVFGLNNEE